MKNILLLLLVLLCPFLSIGQFSVGAGGLFVAEGTPLFVDSLVLTPGSGGLSLASNSLSLSPNPVVGPGSSIKRVYSFASGFNFSGTVGLFYKDAELAGNPEAQLLVAHSPGSGYDFVSTSTVEALNNYVYGNVTGVSLKSVTAAVEGALPVSLIDFRAVYEGSHIQLRWSTSSESNSDRFEIERSVDGRVWSLQGFVRASGFTQNTSFYTYPDAYQGGGVAYYRLKIIDRDERFSYSGIRSVIAEGKSNILSLFPNPGAERVFVEWGGSAELTDGKVYDLTGRLVMSLPGVVNKAKGIDVRGLSAGIYIVSFTARGGQEYHARLLKQ